MLRQYQYIYEMNPPPGVKAGLYVVPGPPPKSAVNLKDAYDEKGKPLKVPDDVDEAFGKPFLIHEIDSSDLARNKLTGSIKFSPFMERVMEQSKTIAAKLDSQIGKLEERHEEMSKKVSKMASDNAIEPLKHIVGSNNEMVKDYTVEGVIKLFSEKGLLGKVKKLVAEEEAKAKRRQ